MDNTRESLRALYAEALEEGGITGKVRCHAILRACERMKIDVDSVVAPLRNKWQQQSYERAVRYETQVLNTIPSGKRLPAPPDSRAMVRTQATVGTYGSKTKAVVGGPKANPFAAKRPRKPNWK
ncbi:MAG: hypothetical protein ICV68_17755 [Pyrinomonadaceae bacterium]|nr:hypothetical protein [Pyrinomonadaceae bacterium]